MSSKRGLVWPVQTISLEESESVAERRDSAEDSVASSGEATKTLHVDTLSATIIIFYCVILHAIASAFSHATAIVSLHLHYTTPEDLNKTSSNRPPQIRKPNIETHGNHGTP